MDADRLELDLGRAVRARRVASGLTRAQLADQANVSLGALRNLETGNGSSIATLVRAVHALGADEWLTRLAPTAAPFSPLAVADRARRDASRRDPARPRARRARRPANAG